MPYLVLDVMGDYPGLPGLFVAAAYSGSLRLIQLRQLVGQVLFFINRMDKANGTFCMFKVLFVCFVAPARCLPASTHWLL